jgi:[methyl-Co(III) methanol-specific corrinoid protein]:coenzyme M methyltransferase
MGGSPGVIGPKRFERWVLPPLTSLISRVLSPQVLSVCGRTTGSIGLLAQAGAAAISVDQLNDVAQSSVTLGADVLLFGNIDPVRVLANGDAEMIRWAVTGAIEGGVDAVWPGCDLSLLTPIDHLRALADDASR